MTYKETLDWMFAQLPMYQNKGVKAYHAKMDGIYLLANHLQNPHTQFKTIHVAGTNGKGSSSHMLASILQESGYKVGLYTSPHLKDFRERIRVNGKVVSKKYVVNFILDNQQFLSNKGFSFFEMTVAMAFSYFADKNVDIAVIEVGLGGRLDSTNIINPEVSLITNIGYDHMDMLGDTLPKIAYEKAGTIKHGVPVVISEYQKETAAVFEEVAHSKKSRIIFAENQPIFSSYKIGLLGAYQTKNVKGVLVALKQLEKFKISKTNIREGLLKVVENTGIMGRWQQIGEKPKIICDTAHNAEGLQLVMKQLQQQQFSSLHMVIGFVKDKDLTKVLPLFPKEATYYFCSPQINRGLDAEILKSNCVSFGLNGNVYSSVKQAFKSAKIKALKDDFIFVGGSNFVVAEVL